MSRRKFERVFAAQAGTTPYDYLLRLRADRALQLLQETGWSVSRIGAEVGIPDPARFSAFLKKRTGKAPSHWKRDWSVVIGVQ
jgi:transcriptional regulator GlxA family with amidase domain